MMTTAELDVAKRYLARMVAEGRARLPEPVAVPTKAPVRVRVRKVARPRGRRMRYKSKTGMSPKAMGWPAYKLAWRRRKLEMMAKGTWVGRKKTGLPNSELGTRNSEVKTTTGTALTNADCGLRNADSKTGTAQQELRPTGNGTGVLP